MKQTIFLLSKYSYLTLDNYKNGLNSCTTTGNPLPTNYIFWSSWSKERPCLSTMSWGKPLLFYPMSKNQLEITWLLTLNSNLVEGIHLWHDQTAQMAHANLQVWKFKQMHGNKIRYITNRTCRLSSLIRYFTHLLPFGILRTRRPHEASLYPPYRPRGGLLSLPP